MRGRRFAMKVNSGWKVRWWRVVLAVSFLAGLLLLPGIAYAQDDDLVECGDAPSSYNSFADAASPTGSLLMTAYPKGGPLGIRANFPVVVFPTAPPSPDGYGMCHLPGPSYMGPAGGPSKSLEYDADNGWDQDGLNNIDPTTDTPDRDGHDDGVTFPTRLGDRRPVNISVEGYVYYVVGAGPEYYIDAWFD
jgi:hypothetical protein